MLDLYTFPTYKYVTETKREEPSQTRLWSRPKPNCYGRRKSKKLRRNMSIPNPRLVETKNYDYFSGHYILQSHPDSLHTSLRPIMAFNIESLKSTT